MVLGVPIPLSRQEGLHQGDHVTTGRRTRSPRVIRDSGMVFTPRVHGTLGPQSRPDPAGS